jgi:ribosomal protein L30E
MEECDSLPIKQPLDANQIEDYDNMSEVPVYDYLGREIGLKSVPRRRKKKS